MELVLAFLLSVGINAVTGADAKRNSTEAKLARESARMDSESKKVFNRMLSTSERMSREGR